jgi:hypothetical protein
MWPVFKVRVEDVWYISVVVIDTIPCSIPIRMELSLLNTGFF